MSTVADIQTVLSSTNMKIEEEGDNDDDYCVIDEDSVSDASACVIEGDFIENSSCLDDLNFIAANIIVVEDIGSTEKMETQAENPFPSKRVEIDVLSDTESVSSVVDENNEDSEGDIEVVVSALPTTIRENLTQEEEESNAYCGPPRTKNELVHVEEDCRAEEIRSTLATDLGLKVETYGDNFAISAESCSSVAPGTFILVGHVLNVVDEERSVIVKSNAPQSNAPPLNEGSIVCLKAFQILAHDQINGDDDEAVMIIGKVLEVFGPVTAPFYLVKLPRSDPPAAAAPAGSNSSRVAKDTTFVDRSRKGRKTRGRKDKSIEATASNDVIKMQEIDGGKGAEAESAACGESLNSALNYLQAYSDSDDDDKACDYGSLDLQSQQLPEQQREAAPPVSAAVAASTMAPPEGQGAGKGREQLRLPGCAVFAINGQCQYLTAAALSTMRVKGSDASNLYDEEVRRIFPDFMWLNCSFFCVYSAK